MTVQFSSLFGFDDMLCKLLDNLFAHDIRVELMTFPTIVPYIFYNVIVVEPFPYRSQCFDGGKGDKLGRNRGREGIN